jgi:cbb3-type cytochrome oxidase maturation protein
MEVLVILIPLSLLLLGIAIWFLFKMIGSGQLEEGEGAAWRILSDNDKPE